jgi:hypothetical protein
MKTKFWIAVGLLVLPFYRTALMVRGDNSP